jgi:hypothetical protein
MRMTTTDKVDISELETINVDEELPDIATPYIMKLTVESVPYEFAGIMLADQSSEAPEHRNHDGQATAPKGVKCSKCRWLEVEIYRRIDEFPTIYVVVTRGPSRIEGERNYAKIVFTESPFEVVEALTVRKTTGTQATFIPPQHARAIAQAAGHDEGMRRAYTQAVA